MKGEILFGQESPSTNYATNAQLDIGSMVLNAPGSSKTDEGSIPIWEDREDSSEDVPHYNLRPL